MYIIFTHTIVSVITTDNIIRFSSLKLCLRKEERETKRRKRENNKFSSFINLELTAKRGD